MHLKPTDIVRRTNSIEHNYEYIYFNLNKNSQNETPLSL